MQITAALVAKEKGYPDSDYRAVIRRLKADQIPESEVMAVYRERLAQIEAAVREHQIVTLPDARGVDPPGHRRRRTRRCPRRTWIRRA